MKHSLFLFVALLLAWGNVARATPIFLGDPQLKLAPTPELAPPEVCEEQEVVFADAWLVWNKKTGKLPLYQQRPKSLCKLKKVLYV